LDPPFSLLKILAAFYAELGLYERSLSWLEEGYVQRSPSMAYLKFDPNFSAEMRADPRFQDLLRRMNLPDGAIFLPPDTISHFSPFPLQLRAFSV
jgi:hypothetical protein